LRVTSRGLGDVYKRQVMPGKGNITRTGNLGDVMKESVEAARTVVRSRACFLGISDDVFEKKDLHIHVPDGGTPKDGPSAGAAMTTSIVSALTGIPVRADVAMTGEITLRGEVTAIGGLKEKLLAALRGDTPAACQHYLACDADPESAFRAQVRLGDLRDDPADAITHYVAAVEGYRALHLPIREAWARLRLVRCGDASQAEDALITFKHAGIASGVAAADLLMQRPGFSLPWHLNAAAEHARGRHDAQRMRAPLTRADADRPERRLLAHRQAIAASDAATANVLIDEMRAEPAPLRPESVSYTHLRAHET
jgi:hypothetical protein